MYTRRCTEILVLFVTEKLEATECSSIEEQMKQMYIYRMEYYSAIKKNEIMPSATTWIDLEVVILREVSQRKTNTICHHLYVESKKGGYK